MVKLHLTTTVWLPKCYCLIGAAIFCIISAVFGDKQPEGLLSAANNLISNNTVGATALKSPHFLTVFSNNSKDVVEYLLSKANSSTNPLPNTDNADGEKIEIDLDETRSELLRVLQSQARIEEDSETHQKLQTISEAKFRTALDEVLKRQLAQARKNLNSGNPTNDSVNSTTPNPSSSAFSSQLVCQFFVFGTLFGVVCSISTCTCCLKPRSERRRSTDLNGVNPTNVPAPIDYSKPYMLKCDSRGSCYASPLSDDEVPPLPSYVDALECARQPTPTRHTKPADVTVVV